jgi:hypothetical protein
MVNIISDYIPPFASLPNIAPFTYKDGETYLSTLDNLRTYVNTTLVTFVNTNYQSLGDAFTLEINALITTVNATVTAMNGDVVSVQALHDQVAALVVIANNDVTAAANSATASSASAAAALIDANNALADVATIQAALTGYVQKGKLVLNVKDAPYNAVGDGVADDTAAVQAALNAANGSIVFFPQGIYGISAPLILTDNTILTGIGQSLYPNFTTDWQNAVPSWGTKLSTIQYLPTLHGNIFSGGNYCTIENLVIRCGQLRTTADNIFTTANAHVFFNNNTVQNMNSMLFNNSTAWGAGTMVNNLFIGCNSVVGGSIVDFRIIDNVFTSLVGSAIIMTSGAGSNMIRGNRFEFANSESISLQAGSRNNIITQNIFDAHTNYAIALNDLIDTNLFSNNMFWRNGRGMTNNYQDAHVYLKNTINQEFVDNIFIFGTSDYVTSWTGPKKAISLDSIFGINTFKNNSFRKGSKTSQVITDRYNTSVKVINIDYIDMPVGLTPNTITDDFGLGVTSISKLIINNTQINIYEDRQITIYASGDKLNFVGVNGNKNLTNAASSNLAGMGSMDNITYSGLAYILHNSDVHAIDIPNAYGNNGTWPLSKKIYNTAPAASGFIGWVKITSGSPDVWKTFGPISA